MKGLTEKIIKNWFYFDGEDTEIERYREYIEIFRNLERKRYWRKKNIEKYYLIEKI